MRTLHAVVAFLWWLHDLILQADRVYLAGDLYARRWAIKIPWVGALRLVKLYRWDPSRDPHDHPYAWIGLVLRGGFVEHRPGHPERWHGPGAVLRRAATDAHRLELSRPTWLLQLTGRHRRRWGYVTAGGWVDAAQYVQERRALTGGTLPARAHPRSY